MAHQFEEYQLPGGAPLVINRVIYNEHALTDCYPGNTLSIMLVNTSAWLIYVAAIFLPKLYWFGLGVILFSLFQILGHCFQMNLKLHTWYNPGMLTTLVLFLPIGSKYIQLVTTQALITGKDWLFAILTLLACIIVTIVLPVQTLKNKQTSYRMSAWQVNRFHAILKFAHVGSSKTN